MSASDALFCEACGYDFITGTMPRGTVSQLLGLVNSEAAATTPNGPADEGAADESAELATPPTTSTPALSQPDPTSPTPERVDDAAGDITPSQVAAEAEIPTSAARPPTPSQRFVAEVWIDPDWYRVQSSPDPLPSPGLPEVFPLPPSGGLIGRASRSQRLIPEVDCGADSGCSRRQAMLTGDGRRWWVEDLGSANGTFVGDSGDPLPEEPIGAGRTELTADSRIYVGAWTRVVVRIATEGEESLFE